MNRKHKVKTAVDERQTFADLMMCTDAVFGRETLRL